MVRGIMWLLRLAIATKRVFLIHSTHPVDLSLLLLPAQIDWRLGNITVPRCTCKRDALHRAVWQKFPERMSDLISPPQPLDIWSPSCSCSRPSVMLDPESEQSQSFMYHRQFTDGGAVTFPEWFTNGSLFNGSVSNVTYLVCSTNMMAHWFIPQRPDVPQQLDIPEHGIDTHCMFNTLFQAAPEVATRARAFGAAVGFSEGVPYVAVHLRLGGFKGEEAAVRRNSDSDTAGVFDCARGVASRHNISAPVMLAVDNAEMRTDAVAGKFPGRI